jgi:hypothetical protein
MNEVAVFIDDDEAYQDWLRTHPRGFVVNISHGLNPLAYSGLHRATCSSISEYTKMAQPGGFTGRAYAKVCSDSIQALRDWVRECGAQAGRFTMQCSRCEPE